jgi:hypothetical protein
MNFASLQHIQASRIHSDPPKRERGSFLTRLVPPSGFGYPRDGLLPATPGQACFILTALMGFRPSKRSPLAGWRHVSIPTGPACRSSGVYFAAFATTGSPNRDFQVLAPARVPGPSTRYSQATDWLLPWAWSSSGHAARTPWRAALTARLPLRASAWNVGSRLAP